MYNNLYTFLKKALTSGWLFVLSANLIISICGFATGIIIARDFGPLDRGILAEVQVWVPICTAAFGLFGVQSVNYLVGTTSHADHRQALIAAILVLGILLGLLSMATCGLINIASFHAQPDHLRYSLLCGLQLPIASLSAVFSGIQLADQRIRMFWVFRLINSLLFSLIIFVLYLYNSLTLFWTCLALPACLFLSLLLQTIEFYLRSPRTPKPDFHLLRGRVFTCLQTSVSGLPSHLNSKTGPLFITYFGDSRLMGIYTISQSFASMVLLLGSSLSTIFISKSTSSLMKNQFAGLSRSIRTTTVGIVIASFLACALCPFFLPLLFGDEYADAIIVSQILCLAYLFQNINLIYNEVARGIGKPSTSLAAEFLGLALAIAPLVLLIGKVNISALAAISLISSAACSLYYSRAIKRHFSSLPIKASS